MIRPNRLLAILLLMLLSGCIFDNGGEKLIGEYRVSWIDDECSRTITYGPIGQMNGSVYSVGWNNDFIIAKRYPDCQKDVTDYFIIDIQKNSQPKGCYDCKKGVFGPFNETEFIRQRELLNVPENLRFTKSL